MSKVTLRDYFTERLDREHHHQNERYKTYQQEQQTLADQCAQRWEHHNEIHKTIAKALELQAAEYERRLDHLNGEQARTKEILTVYLPRDLYESRHVELDVRIRQLEDFKANWTGRMIAIGGFLAVLSAILGGVVAHLLAGK